MKDTLTAIAIFAFAAISFCGGFFLGSLNESRTPKCLNSESVTKADGYGSYDKKSGYIQHLRFQNRERAEKMVRSFNADDYVEQKELKNELVDIYFRSVK